MTLGDACISPRYGCLSSVPDACPGLAFLDHDGSSSFSYCWTGPRLTDVDGVALVLEVQLIYTLVSVSAVQRWGSVMSVAGVGGGAYVFSSFPLRVMTGYGISFPAVSRVSLFLLPFLRSTGTVDPLSPAPHSSLGP